MPHFLDTVPFDVWALIASFSTTSDLSHLSLASSALLSVIRPLFYVHVDLNSKSSTSSATLDLIARDSRLASAVVELALCSTCTVSEAVHRTPFINFGALANLISLRRITINGVSFASAAEQLEFGRVLSEKCLVLESFTYYPDLCKSMTWPADHFGGIHNLKTIRWRSIGKEDICPVWDLLHRSFHTIESAVLPFFVFEDDTYSRMRGMHFPHLRIVSFTQLGIRPYIRSETMENLTYFLLSHDTIEHLELDVPGIYLPSMGNSSGIKENSLPRLHSLTGCPSMVRDMARARMKSLTTSLFRLRVDSTISLQDMFSAILQPGVNDKTGIPALGGLQALREVKLNCTDPSASPRTSPMLKTIIPQCALCCPSLEVWTGRMPRMQEEDFPLSDLAGLFGSFRKLKVIDFLWHDFLWRSGLPYANLEALRTRLVEALASECPTLQEVRMARDGMRRIRYFIVRRDEAPTVLDFPGSGDYDVSFFCIPRTSVASG